MQIDRHTDGRNQYTFRLTRNVRNKPVYRRLHTFLSVLTSSSCLSCSRWICSLSDALSRRRSNSATRCCSSASIRAAAFSERRSSAAALCSNSRCFIFCLNTFTRRASLAQTLSELECGPMPNVMVALPNIGGSLCSTPQFG